jgi:hypothetical protein
MTLSVNVRDLTLSATFMLIPTITKAASPFREYQYASFDIHSWSFSRHHDHRLLEIANEAPKTPADQE